MEREEVVKESQPTPGRIVEHPRPALESERSNASAIFVWIVAITGLFVLATQDDLFLNSTLFARPIGYSPDSEVQHVGAVDPVLRSGRDAGESQFVPSDYRLLNQFRDGLRRLDSWRKLNDYLLALRGRKAVDLRLPRRTETRGTEAQSPAGPGSGRPVTDLVPISRRASPGPEPSG